MVDWLIDRSIDWLIEWWMNWLIDWLINCSIDGEYSVENIALKLYYGLIPLSLELMHIV